MTDLADKRCVPCRGGTPPLAGAALEELRQQLDSGWRVVDGHHLERDFVFADFRQALDFTVAVGELAEAEDHHPDLHLSWGKVRVTLWTHVIDGLAENDFILAAKMDRLPGTGAGREDAPGR